MARAVLSPRLYPSREESMKVLGHDQPEPTRPTPAPGQFQRVLQQTRAPPPPPKRPSSPRAPPLPGTGRPPSQLPQAPGSAAQPPSSSSRSPGAALARSLVLATSRSTLASPENLGQARQVMHGEAHRLRDVRAEAQLVTQEKTEHRLSELISQELARQFPSETPPLHGSRAAFPPADPSGGAPPTEGLSIAGEPRLGGSVTGMAPAESSAPQLKSQAVLELIEKIEVFVRSQRPALRMSLGWPLSAMVEVERTGPGEVALRIQGRQGPLPREELSRIREALGARGLRLHSLHAE